MIPRRNHDLDLLDDVFDDPFWGSHHSFPRLEETHLMKTDIKELKDKFEITMDLPGYEKENIEMSIEDGYLTVHAKTENEKENKDDGKFVRKERFYGECSRSFYVGEDVTESDIKASFKNGTLKIDVPKKEEKKALPEKKYITIE
jgi:HSP20 family molecular chaperone IbpA